MEEAYCIGFVCSDQPAMGRPAIPCTGRDREVEFGKLLVGDAVETAAVFAVGFAENHQPWEWWGLKMWPLIDREALEALYCKAMPWSADCTEPDRVDYGG